MASADAGEIDRINILQASRLAMKRAILKLDPAPDYLLIDAVHIQAFLRTRAYNGSLRNLLGSLIHGLF